MAKHNQGGGSNHGAKLQKSVTYINGGKFCVIKFIHPVQTSLVFYIVYATSQQRNIVKALQQNIYGQCSVGIYTPLYAYIGRQKNLSVQYVKAGTGDLFFTYKTQDQKTMRMAQLKKINQPQNLSNNGPIKMVYCSNCQQILKNLSQYKMKQQKGNQWSKMLSTNHILANNFASVCDNCCKRFIQTYRQVIRNDKNQLLVRYGSQTLFELIYNLIFRLTINAFVANVDQQSPAYKNMTQMSIQFPRNIGFSIKQKVNTLTLRLSNDWSYSGTRGSIIGFCLVIQYQIKDGKKWSCTQNSLNQIYNQILPFLAFQKFVVKTQIQQKQQVIKNYILNIVDFLVSALLVPKSQQGNKKGSQNWIYDPFQAMKKNN